MIPEGNPTLQQTTIAGMSSIADVCETAFRACSCCLAGRIGIHLRVVGQCVVNKTAILLDTSLLPT